MLVTDMVSVVQELIRDSAGTKKLKLRAGYAGTLSFVVQRYVVREDSGNVTL
jgi:hypothetical protein